MLIPYIDTARKKVINFGLEKNKLLQGLLLYIEDLEKDGFVFKAFSLGYKEGKVLLNMKYII